MQPNVTQPNRILVVEDEPKVAAALKEGLGREGYNVTVTHTGEDAYFVLSSNPFDIVLLDIMLPGRSGLEVLRTARRQGLKIPILLLTARDSVEDRVEGLDSGADDYLVKPFALAELLARVRSLLRRAKSDVHQRMQFNDLEVNVLERSVTRSGAAIELTLREYQLLEYLCRHQGSIVSREMLAKEVWKEAARATPLDNVIDVHMARLRKKIDSGFDPKLIHTVRGVGFILKEA